MSTISSCRRIENEHDVERGKDCMRKFCEFLREHAVKTIKFNKKNSKLWTKDQQGSRKMKNAKTCYICKEKFVEKYLKDKKYFKVRDNCHYTGNSRGAAHSICNLKLNISQKNSCRFS